MATVSAHVAATLTRHISQVFGVMGNGNAHFLNELERTTDAVYTAVRHEAGAVVAADACYRAGGGLAAATTTYGAGFTNTLTSLAEAAQARVPLILVTGEAPRWGRRPWDVDQLALASGVGVRTFTVGRTDSAATTMLAIEHALSYSLPAVLAIPYDVAGLDVGDIPQPPDPMVPPPVPPTGDLAAGKVAQIARALAEAERPVLLAGRGAWLAGAAEDLGALAAATGAVTASTALARGIFPEQEYDVGVAGGFGADGAMELVHQADVAVVFGASLNQFTMRFGELFSPSARVIQIDLSNVATHPQVGDYLHADAALAARAILQELTALGAESSGWRESVDIAALREYDVGTGQASDGRLDPRSTARRIAELLPEDRVVVSDGGHFIAWANMYWPVAAPDRMLMIGTAYQAIGQGFPSVAGAARAKPDSTVVLTTGDGGGLMALADLETAVRVAGGRGLAVVWNDRAYGAEIHLYGRKGFAREPMLIDEVDFAGLARAVGAEGVVVRTLDDLAALAVWTQRPVADRPFLLLDLRISGEVMAPYQREVIRVNA
ncbi:thiamine pyrophosphate-binding protein [Ornithinimicrobium sp. F0845]|uniref:thiamine pyrophosphate-binding protein n=1 Tax=Ornithinimicrobium sp. F0845 TaxID=2926412 RepID=UPI001FF34FD9|nr:thiamine pyrophosphate-binding protein [Ornithinimicrobium sp. F0845]MCK0112416.1 thiamine pyrophosphate-binding protein [Ornithinimicrobium sp. F0845]